MSGLKAGRSGGWATEVVRAEGLGSYCQAPSQAQTVTRKPRRESACGAWINPDTLRSQEPIVHGSWGQAPVDRPHLEPAPTSPRSASLPQFREHNQLVALGTDRLMPRGLEQCVQSAWNGTSWARKDLWDLRPTRRWSQRQGDRLGSSCFATHRVAASALLFTAPSLLSPGRSAPRARPGSSTR